MASIHISIALLSCISMTVHGFYANNRPGTCPDPRIENGRHDSMESAWFIWTHPYFKVLNFMCDDGYLLDGPSSATCQMDGSWTELPKCIALPGTKFLKSICERPTVGDNVQVYPTKKAYDLNEEVTFVCPNVRKSGIKKTYCQADGTFYPSLPKCIQPRCVPPEIPQNGGIVNVQKSYAVGEVAHFVCESGYTLDGEKNVTCGKDGFFPYSETECEADESKTTCLRPTLATNQAIYQDKPSYEIGEKIYVVCLARFRIQTVKQLTCLSTLQWSGTLPNCKSCTRPANPANGKIMNDITDHFQVGKIIRYRCDAGYGMIGTSSAYCMENGKFSSPPPYCVFSNPSYVYQLH